MTTTPAPAVRLALGGALTLALVLAVAALSQWPRWQSLPADAAVLRLSLQHGAARNCRAASAEELSRLAPNMRRRQICERRRPPVHLRLALDRSTLIEREVPPSGLWGTGPSRLYARFRVPAGRHRLEVALEDRGDGRRWVLARELRIAPGENLAIDFRAESGGFILHEGRATDG